MKKKVALQENNKEECHVNKANRLPLQLAAIPLSTSQSLNFPPNPVMKPTTCYASIKSPNPANTHVEPKHRNEPDQSPYDSCSSLLQICDKLLQNMFGYDWIEKLRLHRTV